MLSIETRHSGLILSVARNRIYCFSDLRVKACLILLFAIPLTARSQFGIKIGTTVSNFYYPGHTPVPYNGYDIDLRPYLGYDVELMQSEPQYPLFSPYISLYRSFRLSEKIFLRPELSFVQKGVVFRQSDFEKITYKVKINYLELPLSAGYQLFLKERSASNLYLGGYASFRLNAIKSVYSHDTSDGNIELNSVKNFEAGVHLGADYRYRINDHFIFIDLRMFIGLSNIFEMPESWTPIYFDNQKTKITGLNLSIGYEL